MKLKKWHIVVLGCLVLGIIGNFIPKKETPIAAEPKTSVITKDGIKKQFSGFDGSNRGLIKAVKQSMNDPKSFEHVETRHWVLKNDTVIVKMTYRGKNAFGGVVTERVTATMLPDGSISEVKKD